MLNHHALIDTCVWLEIATDLSANEIITSLEDLLATTCFRLVVPEVVREEFDRHKSDCAKKLTKKISDQVRGTIRFAKQFGNSERNPDLLSALNAFLKHVGETPNSAAKIIARIEALFRHPETKHLETTPDVLVRAAKRGYDKRVPFLDKKNSVADAIVLESFLGFFDRHPADQCSFNFITLNKWDFSDPNDHRRPHPDLGEPFATSAIRYSINLAEEINRLTKELPAAPKREKKLLSEAIVSRFNVWPGDDNSPGVCPSCGERALVEGGWRGYTWHKRCAKCGRFFDTGEPMDD